MRERFLREFDHVRIDNLNGDSRETGKIAPDGTPDPSVFSTEFNREGIRVGTAIATLVRNNSSPATLAKVEYREFWGVDKRVTLLQSLDPVPRPPFYSTLIPSIANKLSFRSGTGAVDYESWPSIADLSHVTPLPGMLEKRGGALIGMNRAQLTARMQAYFDPSKTFDEARHSNPLLATDRARYDARSARLEVLRREGFNLSHIKKYLYFTFDQRWAYATPVRPIWNEPRPQILHVAPDACGYLVARNQAIAEPEGFPTSYSTQIGDDYAIHKHAFFIPIIENLSGAPRPNISKSTSAYLEALALASDASTAHLIWHHALATTYCPAYLTENAGGIRQGWPRIPLPDSVDALRASAALGTRLALLLDPDTPAEGVTAGTIRPELRPIAVPTTTPSAQTDWRLAAWGNRTDKGITMPGRGLVEARPYTPTESATAAHADLLGPATHDIYLNGSTFWRCIPQSVWECRIGGYQVLKKWLSYRDASIIDRPLSTDEVAHIQNTARRLAAILLLGPELDASYRACAASHRPLA